MTQSNLEFPSLPRQGDYLETVVHLARELNEGEGVCALLKQYAEQRQRRSRAMVQYMERFGYLGLCLEQLNSTTGEFVDKSAPDATAFISGVITGAMIIESVHQGLVTVGEVVHGIPQFHTVSQADDPVQQKHEIAEQVIELGGQGLERMGLAAEDVLASLEPEIIPDVAKQYMFRVGCGIVALSAYGIHRAKDQEAFRRSMSGLHDFESWDGAFQNELLPHENIN